MSLYRRLDIAPTSSAGILAVLAYHLPRCEDESCSLWLPDAHDHSGKALHEVHILNQALAHAGEVKAAAQSLSQSHSC